MVVRTIAEIIRGKTAITIGRGTPVAEADALMQAHRVSVLVVTDEDGVCGTISQNDIMRRWIAKGLIGEETRVDEIMSPGPLTIKGQRSLSEAAMLMLSHAVRHAPVVDPRGRIAGVLSMRDIPHEYCDMAQRFRSETYGTAAE